MLDGLSELSQADRDEMRRLIAASTPGNWGVWEILPTIDQPGITVVTGNSSGPSEDNPIFTVLHPARKDAELVVAMQRATPKYLDRIESALALHPIEDYTEYGIPVFDEFDKSTERRTGCRSCKSNGPCATRRALESGS